jgi:hypothetical protein
MYYISNAFEDPFPNIQFRSTTHGEIEKIIKSLKTSYSCGYDEISNNILTFCSLFTNTPLSYLCSKVLHTGIQYFLIG